MRQHPPDKFVKTAGAQDVFSAESEDPRVVFHGIVHRPHVCNGVSPVEAVLPTQMELRLQPSSANETRQRNLLPAILVVN